MLSAEVVRDALAELVGKQGSRVELADGHLTIYLVQPRQADHGLTPREVARVLRISPDRVRTLIRRGELPAYNLATAKCGRPHFVVMPDQLQKFLVGRMVITTAPRVHRRKAAGEYY